MSRRDTVIIAVLVNAVLLTLLFVLAVNIEEEGRLPESSIASTQTVTETKIENAVDLSSPQLPGTAINLAANSSKSSSDELDLMLKDLAMKTQMAETITAQTSNAPQETNVQEVPIQEGLVQTTQPTHPVAAPTSVETAVATVKEPEYVEVTVKHGDYLEKIARENGTTISAIKKTNNLKSERINVGQILKVPLAKAKKLIVGDDAETVVASEKTTSEPQYYTILSGDNPWKIAKKFRVKFDDLLKLNNLDEEKARNLKPGDKLRVK